MYHFSTSQNKDRPCGSVSRRTRRKPRGTRVESGGAPPRCGRKNATREAHIGCCRVPSCATGRTQREGMRSRSEQWLDALRAAVWPLGPIWLVIHAGLWGSIVWGFILGIYTRVCCPSPSCASSHFPVYKGHLLVGRKRGHKGLEDVPCEAVSRLGTGLSPL